MTPLDPPVKAGPRIVRSNKPPMKHATVVLLCLGLLARLAAGKEIDPTWESRAANYQVPERFRDGKMGVWMHWGIPSALDENGPFDGSHYGRRMYGTEGFDSASDADRQRTTALANWHAQRYGPPAEVGYEKLIPLFKAEKWGPDGGYASPRGEL